MAILLNLVKSMLRKLSSVGTYILTDNSVSSKQRYCDRGYRFALLKYSQKLAVYNADGETNSIDEKLAYKRASYDEPAVTAVRRK